MGNMCCYECDRGEQIVVSNELGTNMLGLAVHNPAQIPMVPDESEQPSRYGGGILTKFKESGAVRATDTKMEIAGVAQNAEKMMPQEECLTSTHLHTKVFTGTAYDLEGDYCAFESAKTFDDYLGLFYLRASSPTSFCLRSTIVTWSYTLSDGVFVSERGNRFVVQGSSILSQGTNGVCFRRAVDIPLAQVSAASQLEDAAITSSFSNQYLSMKDGKLYKLLKEGVIRLVRGNFLEEMWGSSLQWPVLQEIPSAGLWSPQEAAELWVTFGPAFFVALSYAWLDPSGADPNCFHSERLVKCLRQFRASAHMLMVFYKRSGHTSASAALPPSDVGVFIDRCSLPQQVKERGIFRTPQQEHVFMEGLRHMHVIYGHKCITVIRLAAVPSSVLRTYHLRGWTAFETVVSNSKPEAAWKVFIFDEGFDHWNEKGLALLIPSMANQGPPCSPERFEKHLNARKTEVEKLPYPHNILFANPDDQFCVVADYAKVWEDQSKMKSLCFKNCQWTDNQRESFLEAIPLFNHLKVIDLQGIEFTSEDFEFLLGNLPDSMQEISIHKAALSERAGKRAAVQLPRLHSLRKWSLTHNNCGRGMADIFRALSPSLEGLNVFATCISDPEVDVLVAVLPNLPKLEGINLGVNEIGNASIDILCKAIGDTVILKFLDLSGNKIDPKGKETLLEVWQKAGKDCARLKY